MPPINHVVIRVQIPEGKSVEEVQLFVPVELSQRTVDSRLEITLPRVDGYQGVVVRFR